MTDEVRASLAMPFEASLPGGLAGWAAQGPFQPGHGSSPDPQRRLRWDPVRASTARRAPGFLHGQICVCAKGFAGTRSNEHVVRREGRKRLINNIFDVYYIYNIITVVSVYYGVF